MNIEYVNPFIEASQTVLKQMLAVDAKLGKVFIKETPYKSESIVLMVGLTGKIRGQTVITMSIELAKNIASIMMGGMPVTQLDDISKSAISELGNMILGNAATLLYNRGIGIEITPPSLLTGDNVEITPSKMKTIGIPLIIKDNEFIELDISIEGD